MYVNVIYVDLSVSYVLRWAPVVVGIDFPNFGVSSCIVQVM